MSAAALEDDGDDLSPAEMAERAAEMSVCGMSPQRIAREMGLETAAQAQALVNAGLLSASRRSPADVRAHHLVLTRKIIREASETAANPGPLLDRGGNPVLDDEGYAFPNLEIRDRAHQTIAKTMERESKLIGADAPSRSVNASVAMDYAQLREYLLAQGVPEQLVNMPLDQILALTAGAGREDGTEVHDQDGPGQP